MTDQSRVTDFSPLFKGKKKLSALKGQIFYGADDEPKGVMYIHEGYVKEYDIDTQGGCQLINLIGPSEVFPLLWALDDKFSGLFGEAVTNITYSLMPREEFVSRIENDTAMLQAVIQSLLWHQRFSRQRIQNLELRTARERVAFRLLFLGKYFGYKEHEEVIIAIPVTHQDLAEGLNITRDTANRIMRDFINEGIVHKTNRIITVSAPDKLEEILGNTTLDF